MSVILGHQPPRGAAGPIFQGNSQLSETLADLIGQGKILGFAGIRAQVKEDLHQPRDELVLARSRSYDRLPENAQDLTELLEDNDAALEVVERGRIGLPLFQLAV